MVPDCVIPEFHRFAREVMDDHGLEKWTFEYGKRKKALGSCKYGAPLKYGIIYLHQQFLEMCTDEDLILDTLLHEIAHALEYQRHGSSNHGHRWKEICNEIGCTGERETDVTDKYSVDPDLLRKWRGRCPKCKDDYFYTDRLTKKLKTGFCKTCFRERNEHVQYRWEPQNQGIVVVSRD